VHRELQRLGLPDTVPTAVAAARHAAARRGIAWAFCHHSSLPLHPSLTRETARRPALPEGNHPRYLRGCGKLPSSPMRFVAVAPLDSCAFPFLVTQAALAARLRVPMSGERSSCTSSLG